MVSYCFFAVPLPGGTQNIRRILLRNLRSNKYSAIAFLLSTIRTAKQTDAHVQFK